MDASQRVAELTGEPISSKKTNKSKLDRLKKKQSDKLGKDRMAKSDDLTLLEQQTLMAIMRLDPNAYGVSIRDEITKRTGKEYSFGSIYTVLQRLEAGGMVVSREGEATAERGGRRKSYFTITGIGQKTLKASLNAVDSMRDGLVIGGAIA